MTEDFLALGAAPWTTVLTFAAGYAGYFVAHVGVRDHHQPLDQLFRVLLYGFWGLFGYLALRAATGAGMLAASAFAFVVAVALGAGWRRWGGPAAATALRKGRVSLSDDLPSAWAALFATGDRVFMTQLRITLLDGTILYCEDLARFRDFPDGPCTLGAAGDVLVYVTSVGRRDGGGKVIWSPQELTVDEGGAAMITYVARDQIARIGLRRKAVG